MKNDKSIKQKPWQLYTIILVATILICIALVQTASQKEQNNTFLQSTLTGVENTNSSNAATVTSAVSADMAKDSVNISDEATVSQNPNREIIKAASIKIISEDIVEDSDTLSRLCTDNNGYIASSYIEEHTGALTLCIPQNNAETVIKKIRDTYKIDTFSTKEDDITDSYVDNDARLTSKKAVLNQYYKLLEKAQTVEEIVTVQSRIDEIQADIDSYSQIKKSYDSQINYETISISLLDDSAIETENTGNRMAEALKSGMENFVLFLINLIFLIPAFFIILLIVIIFVFIAKAIIKKKPPQNKDIGSHEEGIELKEAQSSEKASDNLSSHNEGAD